MDVESQQSSNMLQPQLSSHGTLPHEQYLHGEFPALASPSMYGVQHAQHAHDGSPYYQPNAGGGMDSPLDVGVGGQMGLARGGYASPGGGVGVGVGVGGGYSSSPRHYASPRSQPYSPGPQRLAATPQPQQQVLLRYNYIYCLYPANSRVRIDNLVLKHFVPHASPNFQNLSC